MSSDYVYLTVSPKIVVPTYQWMRGHFHSYMKDNHSCFVLLGASTKRPCCVYAYLAYPAGDIRGIQGLCLRESFMSQLSLTMTQVEGSKVGPGDSRWLAHACFNEGVLGQCIVGNPWNQTVVTGTKNNWNSIWSLNLWEIRKLCQVERAVRGRESATWSKWWKMSGLLVNKVISMKNGGKVYDTCFRTVQLYGAEAWDLMMKLKDVLLICKEGWWGRVSFQILMAFILTSQTLTRNVLLSDHQF